MSNLKDNVIPIKEIKQSGLQKYLPQDSVLRDYLSTKDETAGSCKTRSPAKLHQFNEGYKRTPKVLLVMPPMCVYEGAIKRVIPPLGLGYIAANLIKHGYEVDILDCIVEGYHEEIEVSPRVYRLGLSEEEFAKRIKQSDYEIIGFSMIYSSDMMNLYRYAEIVKEVAPQKIVIAGGLHASIYPKQFVEDAGFVKDLPVIDFVIRGEGEYRLIDFIDNLKDGMIDLTSDGLVGWHEGEVFVNPQFTQIEDLDGLPFPAYEIMPLEKYFDYNVPFSPYPRGSRVMQIYTSRGCPIGCTFCSSTNFNKAFRGRSVENVMAEIKHYQEHFDIDEIQFADDNLTFEKARSIELFNNLEKLDIQWCTPNGIMINTLNEKVLDAMIRSGLYQITLSLDSGNADTLKEKHRKPVKLQRVPDLMEFLQDRGVLIHGTLVVGMPGETVAEIEKGFDYVETLTFNSINVFIAQALPGSELFEVSMKTGAITYESSLYIDTAKSTLLLSDIKGDVLEGLVEGFLSEYNAQIYKRDPVAWELKYKSHKNRLAEICIGNASANTSAIMDVAVNT
jgi:anaerobic magnesium-protoporphyrin IX monomethyl ester cyclase